MGHGNHLNGDQNSYHWSPSSVSFHQSLVSPIAGSTNGPNQWSQPMITIAWFIINHGRTYGSRLDVHPQLHIQAWLQPMVTVATIAMTVQSIGMAMAIHNAAQSRPHHHDSGVDLA